jgi:hypothetical protein
MGDIFISYAKADIERARELAAVFEERGHSVWWDRHIAPGSSFDEAIEDALTRARAVIVLWSAESVDSRWVRAEASAAAERDVLVPALIEDVSIPLEFRHIHAANLVGWEGDRDNAELASLAETVTQLTRATRLGGSPPPRRLARRTTPSIPFKWLAAVIGAFVIGAGVTYRLTAGPDREALPSAGAAAAPTAGAGERPAADHAGAERASGTRADVTRPDSSATGAGRRLNLIAKANGGHLVASPGPTWETAIDRDSDNWCATCSVEWGYLTSNMGDEGVFAFRDERPATFDTFTMLVQEARAWNVHEFELFAGNDSPLGRFERIGKFEVKNVRLSPPWQAFTFPPTTAKYLKVRILSVFSGAASIPVQVEEWQLLGTF